MIAHSGSAEVTPTNAVPFILSALGGSHFSHQGHRPPPEDVDGLGIAQASLLGLE